MDTNVYAVIVAATLTQETGDKWQGVVNAGNPDRSFYLTRVKDGMKLDAYRGNLDPWHVTLNLWVGPSSDSRNYSRDRLPYFSSKASADEAGKPWGNIAGKAVGGGINIGVNKTGEQAAKDIIRRLLPLADPAWLCIQDSLAETAAYNDRAGGLADELAAMVGAKATHTTKNEHTIDGVAVVGNGFGSIEVFDNSVSFNLRGLSPDQARALMSALASLKGKV